MSGIRPSLRKRLAKLEQEHADRVRRKRLRDCNCAEEKLAVALSMENIEDFEAEMNRTCPVHGFRSLGELVAIVFQAPSETRGGTPTELSSKLLQLVDTYDLRLEQHSQSSVEPEEENDDDPQEL